MAPTVQPPPLEQGNIADPVTVTFLADTIHKLRDLLLFKATLPKSHGAKNVNIPIEDLCLACSLAMSTCMSLQDCQVGPQLDDINKRLETITTRLNTLAMAQPPANPPYVYTPATGTKCPTHTRTRPSLRFDLTLAQANRSRPVLSDLSNDSLLEKINETLMDAHCCFETRPCTPDCNGGVGLEYIMPCIRAVGRHCSGDIWVATYSEAKCDFLARAAHRWVPQLSDQLSVTRKTCPVLVHGVLTSFNPSRGSSDVCHLIAQNDHLITHPSLL